MFAGNVSMRKLELVISSSLKATLKESLYTYWNAQELSCVRWQFAKYRVRNLGGTCWRHLCPPTLLPHLNVSSPVLASSVATSHTWPLGIQLWLTQAEMWQSAPWIKKKLVDVQYCVSYRCTIEWFTILKVQTPLIVIIKYWLYSLCCTRYSCSLFYT